MDISYPLSPELASVFIFSIIIIALNLIAMWRIFTKAHRPGFFSLIPVYSLFILLKIVKRPGWWLILFFVPFVNIVMYIRLSLDIAKSFGKSTLFGIVGLLLFPIIGYWIVAFGDAEYAYPIKKING